MTEKTPTRRGGTKRRTRAAKKCGRNGKHKERTATTPSINKIEGLCVAATSKCAKDLQTAFRGEGGELIPSGISVKTRRGYLT